MHAGIKNSGRAQSWLARSGRVTEVMQKISLPDRPDFILSSEYVGRRRRKDEGTRIGQHAHPSAVPSKTCSIPRQSPSRLQGARTMLGTKLDMKKTGNRHSGRATCRNGAAGRMYAEGLPCALLCIVECPPEVGFDMKNLQTARQTAEHER